MRSLQRSRYLDCVVLYSVITSTNLRDSVECCEGTRDKERDREEERARERERERREREHMGKTE